MKHHQFTAAVGCVPLLAAIAFGPGLGAAEAPTAPPPPAPIGGESGGEVLRIIAQEVDEVRTVSHIDQAFIRDVQAASLGDVFRVDPEIQVGGGGMPAAQKVYVRGLESTMLGVQIDGAQQTATLYHHQTRLPVDPDTLKAVEVESGAGAATNGPGALGGVIRFETMNASDYLEPGQRIGGTARLGAYSNPQGYKGTLTGYGSVNEGLNILLQGSRYDVDDYEDGNGDEVDITATEADSVLFKLDGRFGDGHRYELGLDLYRDDGPRRVRANFADDIVHPVLPNPEVDRTTERATVTGVYGFAPEGQDLVDLELRVYTTTHSSDQRSPERYTAGPPFFHDAEYDYEFKDENLGFDLRNTSEFELGGSHAATYGAEYRTNEVSFTNDSTYYGGFPASFALWEDGQEEGSVYGVYVQDNWQPHERVTLSVGARYDVWSYDYETTTDEGTIDHDGFSPNAGLSVAATDWLELYTNYAIAIRGIGTSEALWLSDARRTVNPDVDPEEGRNFEVGANLVTDRWNVNAELFRQDIRDYIGIIERDNVGDVEIPGYSVSVGFSWEMLLLTASVNHSEPELEGEPLVNEDNIGLGASAGRTWITTAEYLVPSQGLTFGWIGRFVERLEDLGDNRPDKPGFGVHDLYASWTPPQHDRFNLRLTIKNVFDKYYYEHTSYGYNSNIGAVAGLPEPGRDFRVSAAYSF